jgi:hypothetical protein
MDDQIGYWEAYFLLHGNIFSASYAYLIFY